MISQGVQLPCSVVMKKVANHILRGVSVCFSCRFEGIVVAEEFKEVLLDAWDTEEQLTLEKQAKVCGVGHSVWLEITAESSNTMTLKLMRILT